MTYEDDLNYSDKEKYKKYKKSYKNPKKTLKNKTTKNKNKLRRGVKCSSSFEFNILHANVAGLKNAKHCLINEVKKSNSTIFTINETNFKKKGNFKMDDYVIFETIRAKQIGGTLMGVHKSLDPVLIAEHCDPYEILVIETKIGLKEIRIITGYGPQETWTEDKRMPFFVTLEEEITCAEMAGKSILIAMDANSKLGSTLINGDPHPQSLNGTILAGIIRRHALIVGNGVETKCVGKITRKRQTKNGIEESIVDLVLMSSDMEELFLSLNIDDKRENVITKVAPKKSGRIRITESDHNTMVGKFGIKWRSTEIKVKNEIFNYDSEGLKKFKNTTEANGTLSNITKKDENVNILTKQFLKKLKQVKHKWFKKIKIRKSDNKEIENLYNKRKLLRNKSDKESKNKLNEIEEELANKLSEDLYGIIESETSKINSEEGGFHSGDLWRLKNKLKKVSRDPPTAILNEDGKLVTSSAEIKSTTLKHFVKLLNTKNSNVKYATLQQER